MTWQGWALTLGYVAALLIGINLLARQWVQIAIGSVLTLVFLLVVWRNTEGGWGWHLGLPRDGQ